MRENFKLCKMKVGLVFVVIIMLYIMIYGEVEVLEISDVIGNYNVNKIEEFEIVL